MANQNRALLEDPRILPACAAVILIVVIVELFEGRVWWCRAGDLVPWSWNIWSEHNSQHLIDPYSFTHLLHGILEYWLLGLVFRKMPPAWRLVLAVVIEGSWEIVENSSYVIARYRAETISLNYFGDSITNSVSDILCCASGFAIAHRLKWQASAAVFVITEVLLTIAIHDSLIINIIMLIYPVEAIRRWQMGG